MSEFVKKTMMGYKEVPGGQTDPECTHVILTETEYSKLLRKISDAEQKAKITRAEADKEIRETKGEADRKAQEAALKANQAIEAWRAALDAERAESAHQRGLNEHLLRVAKERANADRKLRPKKEHTGYGVVFSGEKEYRYRDGNRRWRKKLLWETVIQSPYTVDMPEGLARKQITEELIQKDEAGSCLIYEIGINGFYPGSYEDMIDDSDWCAEPGKFNIMMKPNFRVNFRSGYWEAVFFHTKPLGVVPKEMRVS